MQDGFRGLLSVFAQPDTDRQSPWHPLRGARIASAWAAGLLLRPQYSKLQAATAVCAF